MPQHANTHFAGAHATNWLLGLQNSTQGQQFEFGMELFLSAAAQRELGLACGVSHTRTRSAQAMTGLLTCE